MVKWHLTIQRYLENKKGLCAQELFIPATLVPLLSLKHQTYHLFSTSFLTIQTLPATTSKHQRGQVPSESMAVKRLKRGILPLGE